VSPKRVRLHQAMGALVSPRLCLLQRKARSTTEASARAVERLRTILPWYGARCLKASISMAQRGRSQELRARTVNLTSPLQSQMRMEIRKNNLCKSQSPVPQRRHLRLPLAIRRRAILRPVLRRQAAHRPAIRHRVIRLRAIRRRATRPATTQAGEMHSRICRHRMAGRNTDRGHRTS